MFWDGKVEMCNAVLKNISVQDTVPTFLMEIDSDELWRGDQLEDIVDLFVAHPSFGCALFHCHFFVGSALVTTSLDQWSHSRSYEWRRVWRLHSGTRWSAHEPPTLVNSQGQPVHLTTPCFSCDDTASRGLVFTHYAYALKRQVEFKESYYGYDHAVSQWRSLQAQPVSRFPLRLSQYLSWTGNAVVANLDQPDGGILIGRNVDIVPFSDFHPISQKEAGFYLPFGWPHAFQHLLVDGISLNIEKNIHLLEIINLSTEFFGHLSLITQIVPSLLSSKVSVVSEGELTKTQGPVHPTVLLASISREPLPNISNVLFVSDASQCHLKPGIHHYVAPDSTIARKLFSLNISRNSVSVIPFLQRKWPVKRSVEILASAVYHLTTTLVQAVSKERSRHIGSFQLP